VYFTLFYEYYAFRSLYFLCSVILLTNMLLSLKVETPVILNKLNNYIYREKLRV